MLTDLAAAKVASGTSGWNQDNKVYLDEYARIVAELKAQGITNAEDASQAVALEERLEKQLDQFNAISADLEQARKAVVDAQAALHQERQMLTVLRQNFLDQVLVNVPALKITLNSMADADAGATSLREILRIETEGTFTKEIYGETDDDPPRPCGMVWDLVNPALVSPAVAHKMGRRWIMVELGKHCHTHIIPRLQKVVDGEDKGGVTKTTGWKGGGGFRYFSLAPSLLEKDRWGNWVVNKEYNAEMLTAVICKLEGFTYAPSDTRYWQHGHSTETDFIYVTTQTLNADQLQALSDDVGSEKSLLVCCSAFKGDANRYPNLTLKKIPKMVLTKCEWGHDDYSLNVENLPMQQQTAAEAVPTKRAASAKEVQTAQDGLFDETAIATPVNTEVQP